MGERSPGVRRYVGELREQQVEYGTVYTAQQYCYI